jgi:CheY-like chemotaxis protein
MSFQKSSEEMEEEIDIVELESEYKDIKVLVVEDITLNQLLMKTLLDDFGFERDIAGNGKIAIEKLGQKSFDIILMDLQMPEMNGFEATEYIRNQLHSNIPIIALTADVTTVDLEKCKAVGMDDYISKPVDERILYNKIVNLVRKVKMQVKINEKTEKIELMTEGQRYVDLAYLSHRTNSDPKLMLEMIEAYLEQTPPLILTMKKSFEDKDWSTLQAAVHKMIPSFSIVGMNPDYENIAKKIQEYASTQLETERLHEMVLKLETACSQACKELEAEYNQIKLIKREE